MIFGIPGRQFSIISSRGFGLGWVGSSWWDHPWFRGDPPWFRGSSWGLAVRGASWGLAGIMCWGFPCHPRMTLSETESAFYQKGVLCIVVFISGLVWPTTPTHPNPNPLEEIIENCLPGIPNIINIHFEDFFIIIFDDFQNLELRQIWHIYSSYDKNREVAPLYSVRASSPVSLWQ